ncbi:Nas2_N domain-containing protein [Meloidogyne graminicola]|uniref:Nas2_N domain-containing protein n=1 Tax=Meloidogyne graminicola TaxID=189291 RepID=A0A8S9ZUB7_9BILA|nr:Nas2_N domain-containing protein [Meloidogyne graminicola]
MGDERRNRAKELMKELDSIDEQIFENESILKENNVGMNEPLVDEQDFPISGIDIYAVSAARGKIRSLQNDRTEKIAEIDRVIVAIHNQTSVTPEDNNEAGSSSVHRTSNKPIAQVDKVTLNSPAHKAGLCEGDLIIQFGHLHADVFVKLDQLREVVTDSKNVLN